MKITSTLLKTFFLCSLAGFSSAAFFQDHTNRERTNQQTSINGELQQPLNVDIRISKIYSKVNHNEAILTQNINPPPAVDRSFSSIISRIWKSLINFSPPYLASVLLLFILLGLYIWWIDRRLQDLKEKIKKNYSLTKGSHEKLVDDISMIKNYSDNISRQLEKMIREIAKIEKQIIQLKSIQSISQPSRQYRQEWDSTPRYNDYSYGSAEGSVYPGEVGIHPSDTLSIIVENFNKGNENHFNNDFFFFLKPTSATNLGSQGVDINALSKVDFQKVTENTNQASYIGFSLEDQKIYLIPNIFNGRWKQIIRNDENKIFEVSNSNYTLSEPATIRSISNEFWRLEKSGKF